MATMPVVGSVKDRAAGAAGCATAGVGVDAVLATGGWVAAHAVARNRGASERASADERDASEIEFMVTTSSDCVT
jgi:hypothetical protein